MKHARAAASLLLLGLAACGAWTPPAPPPVSEIPAYPGPLGPKARAPERAAPSAFAALRDRVLDAWLADDPSFARSLGLHRFDGLVAPCSAAAIQDRLARLEKTRAALAAVDRSKLSEDEALDLALMLHRADQTLFWSRDVEDWRRRPQYYEDLFSVNGYLDRDYAPIAARAERLLAHEKAALAEVPNIRKNLASPMSKPVLETAIKIYKGYAEYLRTDVPKQLHGVGTPAFQAELAKVNEALAAEATSLADHLRKVELPRGDQSHVLGPERYRKLLRAQEGLDMPIDELRKMGEDDLAKNRKAYDDLVKKKVKLSRPKQAALFDEATRLTEAARRFVIDRKIATLPSDARAIVKETPPFMRWNSAFLDGPGVFEERPLPASYYISLPDPSWPKKEQEEYVPTRGILLATTVHEVYPGHFLQAQHLLHAPTRAQKMLGSYSFVEGWAHYGEELMIEEGFGGDEPENRLGQLADALLRDCRVVVSVGVHTGKMTLVEAERRFMNDCKQDRASAREQAVRATFDPGYFAYTLGKLQILALRAEAKKRLGSKFSLQRFHDALLSHGAPPVALLHDRVLREIGAAP